MQELQNSSGASQKNSNNSNRQSIPQATSSEECGGDTLQPEDLDERWLRWKCLKCSFVYEGSKPLNVCPKCGNSDPDLFDDAS